MFEKRFKIYNDAIKIMNLLMNRQVNKETDDFVIEFNRDVLDAPFLVPDLIPYLEEIRNRARDSNVDLRMLDVGRGTDVEKKKWEETYRNNYDWFSAQMGAAIKYKGVGEAPITEKFKTYLQIKDQ